MEPLQQPLEQRTVFTKKKSTPLKKKLKNIWAGQEP